MKIAEKRHCLRNVIMIMLLFITLLSKKREIGVKSGEKL